VYRKPIGVFLEPDLIQSKAFRELSGTATKVLIWFLRRRRMSKVGRQGKGKWVIENNGEIMFTYTEAQKKYGITKPRFQRALDELIEKGFLDINHHGGGMVKDATTYFISERWRDYGTDKFIIKTRPKDSRGLGFSRKKKEENSGNKRRKKSKTGNDFVTCSSNKTVTGNGSNPMSQVTKTY